MVIGLVRCGMSIGFWLIRGWGFVGKSVIWWVGGSEEEKMDRFLLLLDFVTDQPGSYELLLFPNFADLTSIKRETESNVQASLKNCLIEKPNNDAAELERMNTDIFDTIESSNEIEIIGTSYSNSVTLVPSDSNSDHQSGPNFFRNLSGDSDISSLNNENNKVQVYNATQNEENLQINIEESTSELCSFPSVFPNDPALLPTTISYELKNHFFSLGPCQPSALELKNKIFPQKKDSQGVLRSFHETYYHRMIEDGKFVKRLWLSYSPSQDRFYCITCKLFGFPKAKKIFLADKGSNDYKNIKRTIENHESFPEHLTSEMARGMYEKNLRIDSGMHERANRKVAENRQIVSVILDALIFTARQNIALRGHNEKYTSTNRGNFLELCSFLSTYHPILKLHLEKLKENKINRLSFLSNVTQNKLLCILADMVRTNILKQVNKSGQFAVIIDTTTDVFNQEQFTVILRYIDEGKPQERLVALETAADSTGLGGESTSNVYLVFRSQTKLSYLLPSMLKARNEFVATNRMIVEAIIEIILYLARHSLAFRGHRESWSDNLRGNFKDLVCLLGKYHPILATYIVGHQEKNKNKYDFISWRRQNQILESLASYTRVVVLKQIKTAKFFSLAMDGTFDNSRKEQLAFVIRYLNEDSGEINERLINLKECNNTSSEQLFNIFEKICNENSLNWKDYLVGQSYDGASNMRGAYNGLQAIIRRSNTAAIFVWCYAHRLNFVLIDAVSSSVNAVDMFGIIETVHDFINSSKKRVALFELHQEKCYGNKQCKRRFKRVQTTRWWSHDLALNTVLDTFDALCDTLKELQKSECVSDRKGAHQAKCLKENLICDKFLLTAFIFFFY
ncbi:hypothetical protein QTP88_004043 [Uroleucon formosanum]